MGKQHCTDWLYKEVGEQMLSWVRHGASLEIAAELVNVSESRLNSWFQLAVRFPTSPMGQLIRDLREAAHVAGNGHHSTTGNITGLGHGRRDDGPTLLHWQDL
jgi:hypothetical protein